MLQNSYQDSRYMGKAFLSGHFFPERARELRGLEGLRITARGGMVRLPQTRDSPLHLFIRRFEAVG
jgi:hypothetical protein